MTQQQQTTPAPLVELGGGQVAVVLDPAMLAQLGLAPTAAPVQPPSEAGLFERALKQKQRSEKTKAEYRRAFEEFVEYCTKHCDGRTPLTATDDDLQDFFDHLQSTDRVVVGPTGELRPHPLSPSKLRSVKAALNVFYKLCQKKRHRYDNPVADIELKRTRPKRGLVLSEEEVRKILNAPGNYPRCEAQAYLLHFTGARTESLRYLLWNDVDFANDEIHLDRAKGDKAYTLPLHPELKAALLRWRSRQQEQSDRNPAVAAALADPEWAYVLLTKNGRRLSHSTIAKQYKWRAARAGVRPHSERAVVNYENKSRVSPHAARRTVGTSLRRSGIDVADVAGILNHSDVQTTLDHYAFTTTPEQRKVMSRLRY